MAKKKQQPKKRKPHKKGLRGVAANGSALNKIKSAGMPMLAVAGGFLVGRVIGKLIDKNLPDSVDPAATFFAKHKGKLVKIAVNATGGLLLVTQKSDLAKYAGLGILANGALQLIPAKIAGGLLGPEDDSQILNADYYTENQLNAPEYNLELPRLESPNALLYPSSTEDEMSGMGELKTQDII